MRSHTSYYLRGSSLDTSADLNGPSRFLPKESDHEVHSWFPWCAQTVCLFLPLTKGPSFGLRLLESTLRRLVQVPSR